ncbi:MAG: flagellar assembly protein FliW [Bacillota bacterium]|nr:flagellar assembly protein FliW [Bacillota bacterium]
MILNTKFHGTHEYKDEDIITFKKGIPGFEDLQKFIIFPLEENDVFNVLHSIEDEAIGLIVFSPFEIFNDYNVELKEDTLEDLKIEKEEDVLILNTISLNSSVKKITTNLKAPIVVNIRQRLGEQIILEDEKYLIKHPLFKE